MIRLRAALVLASASLLIQGCVAAAIPVMAGGAILRADGTGKATGRKARGGSVKRAKRRDTPRSEAATAEAMAAAQTAEVVPTPLTELPPPGASGGGGEDAASVLQAYQGLWVYLSTQAAKRKRGEPLRSVVLDTGATLDAPRYMACGDRPLAILIDIDESPARSADADAQWRRWYGDARDALVAVPGAVEGFEAARRKGIAPIFTSARAKESAPGVVAALDRLGFGRLEPGKTLILRGGATADATRHAVAASHCVIALVGDSFDDFTSLLPKAGEAAMQSMAVTDTMVAPLWGAGWFLVPNPVRSTTIPSINPTRGE